MSYRHVKEELERNLFRRQLDHMREQLKVEYAAYNGRKQYARLSEAGVNVEVDLMLKHVYEVVKEARRVGMMGGELGDGMMKVIEVLK